MDAQYPFATREDIWRVHEEVKDLCATQAEHSERLAKLERRKEDDAKMKSLWSPFSPIPSSAGHGSHGEFLSLIHRLPQATLTSADISGCS